MNPTHGLCKDCLSETNWDVIKTQKSTLCITCRKEPDVLYNQQPYCTLCYLLTLSSPTKTQMSSSIRSRGHARHKSYYTPIDKSEYMRKSFLSSSGKLIRKIQKLFDQYKKDSNLLSHLSKKSILSGTITWEKLKSKVTKQSSIIYYFISKTHILGAFHLEPILLDGDCQMEDQQAGIFISSREELNPQFSRVKTDTIFYNTSTQTIKFGQPSSFDIIVGKKIKVITELIPSFQCENFYLYRP